MANGWTTYGKQQMLAIAVAGADSPVLEVSLYTGTADPTASPTEISAAGYSRGSVDFQIVDADTVTNSYDVVIGPMSGTSGTTYVGIGIGDAAGVWFWDDDGGTVTVPSGDAATFPAGTMQVQRI